MYYKKSFDGKIKTLNYVNLRVSDSICSFSNTSTRSTYVSVAFFCIYKPVTAANSNFVQRINFL